MKKALTKALSIIFAVMLVIAQANFAAFAEGSANEIPNETKTLITVDVSDETELNGETESVEDEISDTDNDDSTAHENYNTGVSIQATPISNFTVETPVQSVSLNTTDITIKVGASETLQAIIEPSDATNKAILWYSNNENVATVSETGEVAAASPGIVTITASAEEGNLSASCIVTVVDVPFPPAYLTAVPGDGEVYLSWANTDNNYSPVFIYQISNDNGASWVDSTRPHDYTFTGLTNGIEYTFIVRAVNEVGASRPSDPATATPAIQPDKTVSIKEIIGVDYPQSGNKAATKIAETIEYTGTVVWSPELTPDGRFRKNTIYTAHITIIPKDGYTLNGVPANYFSVYTSSAENEESSGEISCILGYSGNPSPILLDDGLITTSNVTFNSLTLNWTKAIDFVYAQDELKYYVYQSETDTISELADIISYGLLLNTDGNFNIDSFIVSGLIENRNYNFNIIVADELGNRTVYQAISVTTNGKFSQDGFTISGVGFSDTLVYSDIGRYVSVFGGSGDGEVSFHSDNASVMTVDSMGLLTINSAGVAVITAIKEGNDFYKSASDSIVITVDKAPGGAVSVPALLVAPTETTVTVCPVDNDDGTEQLIEYAISQISGEIPVSGWQTDTTFVSLTSGITYYIYARTQENENYHTGTAQQSTAIMTAQVESETYAVWFVITSGRGQITASVDGSKIVSGDMVEKGKTVLFTSVPESGFNISVWTDNSIPVNGTSNTYTIDDISSSHVITMKFEIQIYNVTVNSEGEWHYGSGISPFENRVHIGAGEPPANKRFSHWETSSDGVIFNSPVSLETYFTMPANDVMVTAVFENIPPIVSSVIVTPDIVDVQKGTSCAFHAEVQGEYNPSQSVIWEVLGGVPETVISPDGVLTISVNETAAVLTVRAASTAASDKYGEAVVNVTEIPPLLPTVTGVEITPDAISLNRGDSYKFTTSVTGLNNPNQAVEWSVIGGSGLTSIDSSGKLTVDPDETAVVLTVKATSITDTTQSGTATVTVVQPTTTPIISFVEVMPNTVTVEKGSSFAFVAHVTGQNNPPQSVIWSIANDVNGTTIDDYGVLTVSDDETAEYIIVIAISVYDGTKFNTAIVTVPQVPLTVVPPIANPQTPTITINPQSVTVYVGDRVSLSVTASVTDGGILSYQWYKNGANSNIGGVLIDGATDRIYSPPTSSTGTSYYYVVITSTLAGTANNTASVISNPVAVTVNYYSGGGGNNGGGNGSGNKNNGSSETNGNSMDSGGTTDTPTDNPDVEIIINSQKATATVNEDGILEIVYTDSDLQKFADSSGDYIIEVAEQDYIMLSVPVSALGTDNLIIQTDFGTISIPNKTLQALRRQYGDILRLVIRKGSFIIALIDADGKEIKYNDPDNLFKIMLPYMLADAQKASSVIAVKKTDMGDIIIPLSVYKDGYVTFLTASTGEFDTLYNLKTYTDTENHREIDSISYVSARGLFSGTGNGEFSADEVMLRSMVVTVLARLAGADLSQYTSSRFADVSLDSWYGASVEWAASIGLVSGVGNDCFAPDSPITREQMAAILDRFIEISGYKLTPLHDSASYTDGEDISAWAVNAVRNIHQAGIISGNTNSLYEPQGILSRAEATAVFVRLIETINR